MATDGMMRPLRLSLVQGRTRWHDAAANRAYYSTLVDPLRGQTDLIVLPETFMSGFTNETIGQAESMEGDGVRWMRDCARDSGAAVTGSLVVRENGRCTNRLIWMRADGSHEHYDKRHLFRMAGEHERYAGGLKRLVIELHGWQICPQVCYDLRFPVWSRNRYDRDTQRFDYDLLLYVANWPAARRQHWRTLLRARAIENLCYCVGVNRIGVDGNEVAYAGDSALIDQVGEPVIEFGASEQVATVVLDPVALGTHRERFPAWMDADRFNIDLA